MILILFNDWLVVGTQFRSQFQLVYIVSRL